MKSPSPPDGGGRASRRRPGIIEEYGASGEMDLAREALARGRAELGGFWGASLAFFLAAWKSSPGGRSPAGSPAGRPCLVIAATQVEADEILDELEAFSYLSALGFPAWESLFLPESLPDGEIYRQRLRVLEALQDRPADDVFIVAPVQAVIQPVPSREILEASRISFRTGDEAGPKGLAHLLAGRGFRHVPLVQSRGEFSSRGDIFDVFPHGVEHPLRLEFFGETLESIREFRPDTQRTVQGSSREEVRILVPGEKAMFRDLFRGEEALITDFLDTGAIFLEEPRTILERAQKLLQNRLGDGSAASLARLEARLETAGAVRAHTLPVKAGDGGVNLRFASVERFRGADLEGVFSALSSRLESGYRIDVYCENEAEAARFREIVADHGLSDEGRLGVRVGPVRRGFEVSSLQALILTSREIFNRHAIRRVRKRTQPARAIQSFLELEKGDYVVHVAHGIGRYLGMEAFEKNGVMQEFLALEFRDKVKVYVPVSRIDLVQKYVGGGDRQPILDKVGGTSWTRKKEEVESALFDLASDLIEIQALRSERPGVRYPADSEWQREFEAAFAFEETPDQVEVNEAIKTDMRSDRPMDRLICGDVGYGKTELAMRATFKAVDAGKQVAVLVPTTVLAQQHFRTFSERMSSFPITVGMLSRFRTPSEQRKTIRAAEEGKLDVLIGTHRLLSDDVGFHDLGLVIIDEEQRFGVAHKEKLKRMRSTVDVLTLTATPIPRTLHMGLLGIRDISSLTTAPEGRNAVKTEVCRFDPGKVREIIIRELDRDGQVFFVHNRIYDIDIVQRELERIAPEARIEYAHGQMNEHELEEKMLRFYEKEFDVLISTTIIESGLDIPNVNTIFIDEADRYGLADLHQLRGRVGRYKHQAYCYLLLPDHRHVQPDAQKRVQALVEFSELGAGFQIAMRDLEIRGAGNILGPEQSGHIAAVGYDMYCRLLEKAVKSIRNEAAAEPVSVEVDLELEAFVPDEYIPQEAAKLEVYRRVSAARSAQEIEELGRELTDRYGAYPSQVARLLDLQRLRVLCAGAGIERVGREDRQLILRGSEILRALLEGCPARLAALDARTVAVSLSDPRRRYPPPVTDERAFRVLLSWLETGMFPDPGSPEGGSRKKPVEFQPRLGKVPQ